MSKLGILFTAIAAAVIAQPSPRPPAIPVEPVQAILDAFRTHSIVAIGNVEFRGNEQSHAFRMALIRDPRITAVVQDIVVEFGTARFQSVMDRFIAGENIPDKELQKIWQDTTQIEFEWDLPIYEEFFRAVRSVNASLPAGKPKLRVLLGDPPMDWDVVHTRGELDKVARERDTHAAEVIRREVLAKNRRALLIYGGGHLFRRSNHGIVGQLGSEVRVFTILPETRRDLRTIQPDIESWPVPSLTLLKGTVVGDAPWSPRGGPVRLEEQADALLYLGPPSSMTMSQPTAALCGDQAYMQKRMFRLGLVGPPPGAPSTPAQLLQKACAALAPVK